MINFLRWLANIVFDVELHTNLAPDAEPSKAKLMGNIFYQGDKYDLDDAAIPWGE